jgi:hypothetical protein
MRTLIVNGVVVNGDGIGIRPGCSVVIEDGIIAALIDKPFPPYDPAGEIIDARGGFVIPGLINHHSHGGCLGPFNVFGEKPLPWERVRYNLDRHLSGGTTALINACGWPTMAEVEAVNKRHPIRVFAGTTHCPAHLAHARAVDGRGLQTWHERMTVVEMLRNGAVAIGEVGAPCAAYGTPQIARELAVPVTVGQVQALKQAVLGSGVDPDCYDRRQTLAVLERMGLNDRLTPAAARDLMDRHVVQPLRLTIQCAETLADLALRHDIALLFHNTPDTRDLCLDLARKLEHRLIALHTNYAYTPEQALACARELRQRGARIDIFTADSFGAKAFVPRPDVSWALFSEGLVDLISTDYIAGYWDPIPVVLENAVRAGFITHERAVAMCTRAVVEAIPRLGVHRGTIGPGQAGDIVVTGANDLSRVAYVIIGGRTVVAEGRLLQPPERM